MGRADTIIIADSPLPGGGGRDSPPCTCARNNTSWHTRSRPPHGAAIHRRRRPLTLVDRPSAERARGGSEKQGLNPSRRLNKERLRVCRPSLGVNVCRGGSAAARPSLGERWPPARPSTPSCESLQRAISVKRTYRGGHARPSIVNTKQKQSHADMWTKSYLPRSGIELDGSSCFGIEGGMSVLEAPFGGGGGGGLMLEHVFDVDDTVAVRKSSLALFGDGGGRRGGCSCCCCCWNMPAADEHLCMRWGRHARYVTLVSTVVRSRMKVKCSLCVRRVARHGRGRVRDASTPVVAAAVTACCWVVRLHRRRHLHGRRRISPLSLCSTMHRH